VDNLFRGNIPSQVGQSRANYLGQAIEEMRLHKSCSLRNLTDSLGGYIQAILISGYWIKTSSALGGL
jgi:hypothetical protein